MIPLRDTIPSKNYPVVNNTLIGINIVIYLLMLLQNEEQTAFIYTYGLVPVRYTVSEIAQYFTPFQQIFSLISFMFLHGGFLHVLGNMWSLYIFGDNVEDHLGHARYLFFYLFCGLASGLSHMLLNLGSNIPVIGASGAIAGVMGAYLILYPRAKILTLIPIIIIPFFIEISAFFFLGFWFLIQFLNAAGSRGEAGGIAWWAHVGGFVFGIIFLKILTLIPETGISKGMKRATLKKGTKRLQVIRPAGPGNDHHLYGTMVISPHEAVTGTNKLVNIPRGFKKRLIQVKIPAGMKDGKILRLKGLGKHPQNRPNGDLFLKIHLKA